MFWLFEHQVFSVLILVFVLILVIAFDYYLFKKLTKRMGRVAMRQGLRNMSLMFPLVILILGGIFMYAHFILSQSIALSIMNAYLFFFLVANILLVLGWLVGKLVAGAVLLDIMPFPMRGGVIFVMLLFFSFFTFPLLLRDVVEMLVYFDPNLKGAINSLIIFLEVPLFFFAIGRIQIYQNGVWLYAQLLKWKKIDSYQWVPNDQGETSAIRIIIKGSLPVSFRNGAIPIPNVKKDEVLALFRQFLPGKEVVQNHQPVSDIG